MGNFETSLDTKAFMKALLAQASLAGFTESEVFFATGKNFSILIHQGEVDHFENSVAGGVSFRGVANGKMGYAYSEKIHMSVIDFLIREAMENASIIEEEMEEVLYAGENQYPYVSCYDHRINRISISEKINMAKEMESAALHFDKRIETMNHCAYEDANSEISICNSKGLAVGYKKNSLFLYASSVAKEDGDVQTGDEFFIGAATHAAPIEVAKEIGWAASQTALSYLGAKPVATKIYPCVIKNTVAASILSQYASIFFADTTQKGFSLLSGKLGKKIASGCVTIKDDALLDNMLGSAPFDSEGVATKNKFVVEAGMLKTFLYNMKTAAKDGVSSTGNGFKGSFKSPVETACTNFYIAPGKPSVKDLLKSMEEGVWITEISGLHAGANTVSGDFSLSAQGFLVQNGQMIQPIEQITISGNFYTLLQSIEAVAEDLRFSLSGGLGYFGSASLYVPEIAVSGTE